MYFDRGRILRELGEELDGEVSDSSTEIVRIMWRSLVVRRLT
jgi:hypothetical protein